MITLLKKVNTHDSESDSHSKFGNGIRIRENFRIGSIIISVITVNAKYINKHAENPNKNKN